MGVFGGFVYGGGPLGDVYGPDGGVRVDILSNDMVRILFEETIVVNSSYSDVSNYTITSEDSSVLRIRRVLVPTTTTTNTILLVTDTIPVGVRFTVEIDNLSADNGTSLAGISDFIARRTKTQSILQGLPNFLDTRPESVIRHLAIAIGESDDLIGGSRSDQIT